MCTVTCQASFLVTYSIVGLQDRHTDLHAFHVASSDWTSDLDPPHGLDNASSFLKTQLSCHPSELCSLEQ